MARNRTINFVTEPKSIVVHRNLIPSLKPNYAFNPIAEQALRTNQTVVPQRVNAALGVQRSLEELWLGSDVDVL